MTIGMDADELVNVFSKSFQHRQDLLQSMAEGATVGENPQVKEILEKAIENMRRMFPNFPYSESLAAISVVFANFLYALMDTVVENNNKIEKQLQHIQ